MKAHDYARPYRVNSGKGFKLSNFDPRETRWVKGRDRASELLQRGIKVLSEMQEKLYAQDRWALLLIFQAMDAAGKDGTIEHVMSGVNPQGVQVYSFKSPSAEELDHDFLWRTNRCLPERGRIGIFNRSYYEETLVVRVHQDFLSKQKMPGELVTKKIWNERFEDINACERYLTRQGIAIRKFFLYVSKEEQRRRFLKRLDEPAKNWKFSLADAKEREYWDAYMDAYEDTIRHTATKHAPWFVVPADHKWFTRLVVAAAVIDALDEMNLAFPKVDESKTHELEAVRHALAGQEGGEGKRARREAGGRTHSAARA
jgi:PPK2 family polyphosphate:nucleotide phosphotransferase